MLRELVFLALVGGAGFGAWNTFPETSRSALNWAVNEAHARVCKPEAPSANQPAVTKAQPVVLQTAVSIPDDRFLISKETLAAITCGPWDVSEDGMEAILQEMIRRGWTPPSGGKALEASRHNGGLIEAVDPDATVPAVTPPMMTVVATESRSSTKHTDQQGLCEGA